MVDSVADWPLYRVVEKLRQKEKDERLPTATVFCRSAIKSLMPVIGELANRYSVSRNRMCSWLAYHGLMFAREDAVVGRLSSVWNMIRQLSLLTDDVDTIDLMQSLLPYSPRIQEDKRCNLSVYDWVSSEFDELSEVCGVPRFRMVQVYIAKSILSDNVDNIAGTASRLGSEVSRWDWWMKVRLGALEQLADLGK
jgi:hypothetical protein